MVIGVILIVFATPLLVYAGTYYKEDKQFALLCALVGLLMVAIAGSIFYYSGYDDAAQILNPPKNIEARCRNPLINTPFYTPPYCR